MKFAMESKSQRGTAALAKIAPVDPSLEADADADPKANTKAIAEAKQADESSSSNSSSSPSAGTGVSNGEVRAAAVAESTLSSPSLIRVVPVVTA